MQKYKLNRKLIEIECENCHCLFHKPLSEYNRNIKLNRSNYCSRKCCGHSCNKNGNQKGNYEYIKNYTHNRLDEYTPFRYYIRNCKKRFKEFNLDLEILKSIWDSQKGICPYSGVKLILSTYTKGHKNPIYSASLDRIDSSIGYVVGNVQFVSTAINYMKNTMTHEETIKLCKIIANNFLLDRTISSSSTST